VTTPVGTGLQCRPAVRSAEPRDRDGPTRWHARRSSGADLQRLEGRPELKSAFVVGLVCKRVFLADVYLYPA